MLTKVQLTLLFLCLLGSLSAQQTKLSADLIRMSVSKKHHTGNIGVLIKGNPAEVKKVVEGAGGHFCYNIGSISSVSVPVNALTKLAACKSISRIEQGSIHLHPLNDTMVYLNNVVEVHNGLAPLSQAYDGKGIVCGFIDTGIDFTHGDFKDSLGKTRVKFIWDQTFPAAPNTPQPFNYGQEWTNVQIDSGHCAHTDTAQWGHGTRVAGTAAGNGRAVNRYEGVAPRADIIMVAVDFNNAGPTISDGAVYIFTKALAMGEPCVINCSLGSEMGSHDGSDLQTQIIDSLLDQHAGRAFVAATGNSGNIPYHLTNTLSADSSFTWMRFNSTDSANGTNAMDVQIFGDTTDMKNIQFALAADQQSPTYALRGRLNFRSLPNQLGVVVNDTIWYNGKRVALVQSIEELVGAVYSIEYYVTPDSTYYNYRVISNGTGKFDAWCFQFLASPPPNAAVYPPTSIYKASDFDETIETSFQCSQHVISVANYVNKNCFTAEDDTVFCDTNARFAPRRLAPSSGHGPNRLDQQKPDIAATGDYVFSCMVMAQKQWFSPETQIAFGGMHIVGGGTSQASPVITGISALLLQQNPGWTWLQVKNAVTCGAKSDIYTGTSLPDYKWGYGKADAFHSLTGCSPTLANGASPSSGTMNIWPNPFTQVATVSFTALSATSTLLITDVLGREINRQLIKEGTKSITLSRDGMIDGIYLVTLQQPGKPAETRKLAIH